MKTGVRHTIQPQNTTALQKTSRSTPVQIQKLPEKLQDSKRTPDKLKKNSGNTPQKLQKNSRRTPENPQNTCCTLQIILF
ncbi:MAG: hypothetical protein GY694_05405 [Gammaproteobacteria bacterium]|nr:hypothetical protein [Gammaproteobacteria bacterium]